MNIAFNTVLQGLCLTFFSLFMLFLLLRLLQVKTARKND